MLIQTIEELRELGEDADGEYSRLKIVEIPDSIKWKIIEHDGLEIIVEINHFWE